MSGDKVLPSNATRERRLHNRQITMKGILDLLHLQSCRHIQKYFMKYISHVSPVESTSYQDKE